MEGVGEQAVGRRTDMRDPHTNEQHVFVRISGFRLTVVPRAPFRIERAASTPGTVQVEHDSPQGRLTALLVPKDGGYTSKLSQSTAALGDVLDVTSGLDLDEWRIETTLYACRWPTGYVLCSNAYPRDPAPFDLVGANGEIIFVQNPQRMPVLEEMCAPGQTVKRIEKSDRSQWIELEYQHDDRMWVQRHEVLALSGHQMAVTMQALEPFAQDAIIVAQELARSIVPFNS